MDPREVMTRPAEGPDAVIRYADHADGLIDVFLPPGLGRPAIPMPLVVLVHGGFWMQEYDRTHVRPLANALTQHGLVVAVPEYRRIGGLGGWPMTYDDVAAAIDATPAAIASVAPGYVDPSARATLVGHSAGGHLAMLAALSAPERAANVIALAPVADLRYAALAGLGDNATQALLGGEPDQVPDAYRAADPAPKLPGSVPITIIQGTEDEQVPVDHNRRLAQVHREAPAFRYIELPGIEHFALIDPLGEVFTPALLPALSFGR